MSLNPFAKARERLECDFQSLARPNQRPPEQFARGDKAIWLLLAGRGFGKTFAGSQWVRQQAETGQARRIALVGPTAADVRDVMIAAILENSPPSNTPRWEPSKRSLTWPNGAQALAFSAEEPERIRGFGFEICWCDELAAWGRTVNMTWDMLQFTMRRGRHPRQCITTTPKSSVPLLLKLLKRSDVVVTRGSTRDNPHLSKEFLASIEARYAGTRLGRQELDAELLLDVENALWTHEMLEQARAPHHVPDLERVVVGVDPSGTGGASDSGDAIGIVAAGKGSDGRCYVLADKTIKASPDVWGRRVIDALKHYAGDRIVAERNFGGALVENLLRTIDRNVPYREVVASRGKVQRAEPIAALYEQHRVSHVASMPELEQQMLLMTSQGYQGDGSPDRVDALVWALSELMVTVQRPQFVFGGIEPRSDLEVARHAFSTDHYR